MADQVTGNLQHFIKQVSEEGEVEAYVTTFGNTDVVGDIIKEGALDEFVDNFEGNLPMLWQHNQNELIGEWNEFRIDDKGVIGKGQLYYKEVQRADEVRKLMLNGKVNSVSIGFTSNDYDKNEMEGYTFNKITLREVSAVVRPANPEAKIMAVKNEDGSINYRALERILRDAGFSRKASQIVISAAKSELEAERDAEQKAEKAKSLAEGILSHLTKKGDI